MQLRRETCVRVWCAVLLVLAMAGLTTAAPAMLPSGWSSRDIGIVGTRGQALNRGGAFVLRGAGTSVGERSDSFQFAYRLLRGDGEIVARVSNVGGASPAAAGVMLRESLLATSRFVYIRAGAAAAAFQQRGAVTAAAPAPSRCGGRTNRDLASGGASHHVQHRGDPPAHLHVISADVVSDDLQTSRVAPGSRHVAPIEPIELVERVLPVTLLRRAGDAGDRRSAFGVATDCDQQRGGDVGVRPPDTQGQQSLGVPQPERSVVDAGRQRRSADGVHDPRRTRRHHANGWRARDRHI